MAGRWETQRRADAESGRKRMRRSDYRRAQEGALQDMRKLYGEGSQPTALDAEYKTDPALRQAQMDALAGLQDTYRSGGFTAADKAAIELGNIQAATAGRGAREAAMSNARARGLSGSAIELANTQRANQGAADRAYQGARENQIAARDRAMQAMIQRSQMAGSLNQSDLGQQEASNRIRMFNQEALSNWRNAAAQNQANIFGLAQGERQRRSSNLGRGLQAGGMWLNDTAATVASMMPSGGGGCWVAREIYGIDDPKWIMAREFIFFEWKGPIAKMVQRFYTKYGERIAEFIKHHPYFKVLLKPLFDLAVKKYRGGK